MQKKKKMLNLAKIILSSFSSRFIWQAENIWRWHLSDILLKVLISQKLYVIVTICQNIPKNKMLPQLSCDNVSPLNSNLLLGITHTVAKFQWYSNSNCDKIYFITRFKLKQNSNSNNTLNVTKFKTVKTWCLPNLFCDKHQPGTKLELKEQKFIVKETQIVKKT